MLRGEIHRMQKTLNGCTEESLMESLTGIEKAPFWTGGGMKWKWTLELKLPLHLQSLGLDFLLNPHTRPQPLCCAPNRSTPSHSQGHPVLSQVYIRFGINFLDSLTTCFGLFSLSLDLFSLVFVVFFFLIERKRC